LRLRDLFSLRVDMVFYDLTSTYFEGQGPATLGANGHSRDGKPRNRQVLVGVVIVDGWPIAHHIFAGNRRDANTVPDVLRDLAQRFGLKRVVFVGDRGMVTSQNLEELRGGAHGYIVGRNRRRSSEVFTTHPECDRAVDRMSRGHHHTRADERAEDVRAGGGRKPARRARVRRPLRRTRGLRVDAAPQGDGACAHQARSPATPRRQGPAQGRRHDRCRVLEEAEGAVLVGPVVTLHFPREQAYEGKYVI
jgi:hypothetical protein